MLKVKLKNQKFYELAPGEIILSGALNSNIVLEHSCKTGRCGTCKVKEISGSSEPVLDEISLNQHERDSGWILTCARKALSDLDIEDLGNVHLAPPNDIALQNSRA